MGHQIKEKEKYERKIIAWLELVTAGTKEKTASMAKLDLASMYREKKEYEKAQEVLDKIPEIKVDKKLNKHYYLKVEVKLMKLMAFGKANYGEMLMKH
ncbi:MULTISPECIES: hypothetical protein [unclassified Clostridium]|uniref:hypothetical protein n=1 Tax=unclassified Clostridium TaxID=2614128 RepID=UPI0002979ED4|nr:MULTISPECIES: hypothetical protein [unclassified Clostridium]EKQ57696.1 MAG: hypothetical protein A370_00684 [Clostridium sp. Maddingley MBC34-26]